MEKMPCIEQDPQRRTLSALIWHGDLLKKVWGCLISEVSGVDGGGNELFSAEKFYVTVSPEDAVETRQFTSGRRGFSRMHLTSVFTHRTEKFINAKVSICLLYPEGNISLLSLRHA